MISGTLYEQGEILIVPFSDLSEIKQRPVLVLSRTDSKKDIEDIIICGITSNLRDTENSVLIENKDLETGQIPVQSRIKVDKMFTIKKSIIKKRLGKINHETLEKVKKIFVNLV